MRREELNELHYITLINNVASILLKGILSHRLAANVQHGSIAMPEVQEIRSDKRVPGGRMLHEYVNMYCDARNPMMYKRKEDHAELCILRISTDVFDLNGVIVTDRNAATRIARFSSVDRGLALIDRDLVFAESWYHPDDVIAYNNHRSIKCAEVLVPKSIPPHYISGAYVSCIQSKQRLRGIAPQLPVSVNAHLFFF
jgi:hypothetical protein